MRRLHVGRPRRALGIEEIAGLVRVQVEVELVVVRRHDGVVVEALVEVRLAVAVQVMQPRELVAAGDVNLAAHDLKAERLKHPGGEPLPRQLALRVIEAADNPHIAVEARNRRATIRQEVEAAEEGLRVPRVRDGRREVIHHVRAVGGAGHGLHHDGFSPTARRALGEGGEAGEFGGAVQRGFHGGEVRLRTLPERDAERLLARRNLREHTAVRVLERDAFAALHRDGERLRGFIPRDRQVEGELRARRAARRHRVAHDQRLRRLAVQLDGARDDIRLADFFHARHLQHLSGADGVFEHHVPTVEIEAAILGPLGRETALFVRAPVVELAGHRPTGADLRAEERLAQDLGRLRVDNLDLALAELEVVARPRHRDAHQVGVVADMHVAVRAHRDDHALHSEVVGDRETALDGAGEVRPALNAIGSVARRRGGRGEGDSEQGEGNDDSFHRLA